MKTTAKTKAAPTPRRGTPADPEFLTVQQAADAVGIGTQTVREAIDAGELPGRNFGGSTGWRLTREALHDWINGRAPMQVDPTTVDLDTVDVALRAQLESHGRRVAGGVCPCGKCERTRYRLGLASPPTTTTEGSR